MRIIMTGLFMLGLYIPAHADPMAEWQKADAAALKAWQQLPLTVHNVLFASEKPKGYGVYTARNSNVFKPTEKLITYAELLGYTWSRLPTGQNELDVIADITIRNAEGDTVMEQERFMQNFIQSYRYGREFYLSYTLTLTGAPQGRYTLTYTLHDTGSGKSTSFDQQFEIRE